MHPEENATVEYVRTEVTRSLQLWELCRDSIGGGQEAIKKRGVRYLPKPNEEDESPENTRRYEAYKRRALYQPVTQRTAVGFLGEMFQKSPMLEIPEEMALMKNDFDGGGANVLQFAKGLVFEILQTGRAGLLSDFPDTKGSPASKADVEANGFHPTIKRYPAESIINWHVETVGAKTQLKLVVLKEVFPVVDAGGFGVTLSEQYRELRLSEGIYTVTVWRKNEKGIAFEAVEKFIPQTSSGAPFNHIPFHFVGAEDNSPQIGSPPLLGMANVNVSHYINSAEVEDSAHFVGQPTLVLVGLTEDWLKSQLKGKVTMGSRVAVPLPEGGDAKLVQAEPNNLALKLMEEKMKMLVALGARLVEPSTVQKTATEAGQEEAGKASVISTIIHNVNAAVMNALVDCSLFVTTRDLGQETEQPELWFEIPADFAMSRMTAQERQQLMTEWQAGAIDFEEYRSGLKESGVAWKDDEEVTENIQAELMATRPTAATEPIV